MRRLILKFPTGHNKKISTAESINHSTIHVVRSEVEGKRAYTVNDGSEAAAV